MRTNFAGNTVVTLGSCTKGQCVQVFPDGQEVTVLGTARGERVTVSNPEGTMVRLPVSTLVIVLGDYANGEADVQAVAGSDYDPFFDLVDDGKPVAPEVQAIINDSVIGVRVWIIRTETIGRSGEPYYLVSGSKTHWDSTTDPTRAKQFKTEAKAAAYLKKIGATYCTPILMPLA